MTTRLRYAQVATVTPAPDPYTPGSVTVMLDGVEVPVTLPTSGASVEGILAGDVAWCLQEGRRLVWAGYIYPMYWMLGGTYGDLYDLDIPYSQLGRVALGAAND